MTIMKISAAVALLLAVVAVAPAGAGERLWFGGHLGASFGDVDIVDVSPVVGFAVSDALSIGGGVSFRYRKDDRFPGEPSSTDYGANAFARYRISEPLFLQAEVELLSYEYLRADLTEDRDTFESVLAGAGFVRPLGRRTSLYGLALYNFSYDDDDLVSPYDDDWVYRVGVTVGF